MEVISVGNSLNAMQKDELIKFAQNLNAKVGFHEIYGMYINIPTKEASKKIKEKLNELRRNKSLT